VTGDKLHMAELNLPLVMYGLALTRA
jgi:hypothetical protein